MKPSVEQCKMLTELIGECFHVYNGTAWVCLNAGCQAHVNENPNRTFTSWADIEPVMKALVEKGLWMKFMYHVEFCEQTGDTNWYRRIAWLFGTDQDGDYRFCGLVISFLETEKKNV